MAPYSSPRSIEGSGVKRKRRRRRKRKPKSYSSPRSIEGAGVPRGRPARSTRARERAEVSTKRTQAKATRRRNRRIRKVKRIISKPGYEAPEAVTVDKEGRVKIPADLSKKQIRSLSPLGEVGERLAAKSAKRAGLPSDKEAIATAAAILGPGKIIKAAKGAGGLAKAVLRAEDAAKTVSRGTRAAKAGKAVPKAGPKPKVKPTRKARRVKPKVKAKQPMPRPKPRKARRVARGAGKVAGTAVRVGTAPIRHPLKVGAPAALAPSLPEVVTEGSLNPVKSALEGAGKAQAIAHDVGEAIADVAPGEVADNLVRDLIDLPTAVVPSIYLVADAAVSAAKGDDEKAREMIDTYVKGPLDPETGERGAPGLLPAIFQGDPDAVLASIKEHPLFGALEVSGAYAVAGRGGGAVARRIPGAKKAAGTKRSPRKIYGDVQEPRRYSANVLTKGAQVAREKAQRRRGKDPDEATPKQRERYLKHRVDFEVAMRESVRRSHADAVKGILPEGVIARVRGKGAPKRAQAVVALIAQRIVRDRHRYRDDLEAYGRQLDKEAASGRLTRSERKANRTLAKDVRAGLRASDKGIDKLFEAAGKYGAEEARLRGELVDSGMLASGQAAKAAVIPFATVHMGAKFGKPKGGGQRQLLARDGKPLSREAIEGEMARQGVDPAAFLSQRPGSRGAGSFYQPFQTGRGTLRTGKRTGRATERGTFDASIAALSEQLVRSQTVADRAAAYDGVSKQFGLRKQDGSYFKDRDEAERAATDPEDYGINLPPDMEFVPWRTQPFPTKGTERAAAQRRGAGAKLEALDPDVMQEGALRDLINSSDSGAGDYVLIPAQVRKRLLDHVKQTNVVEKGLQSVTTAFKSTVLPTSPRWMQGNAIEASIRHLVNGTGVFDWMLGRRMLAKLRELDPEAAARLEGAALGGQLMGSQRRINVHRSAEQFEGTILKPFAKVLSKFRATPGPGTLVAAYKVYRDFIYRNNARFIERTPQFAALGKEARRQLQETNERWFHALQVGDDALTDLAKGLRNTDKQIQYARAVEQVVGQWHRFEPGFRFMMTSYSPFIAWARAATRFVALTLPRHHPILTGLAAVANEVTQEEREALGLSHFADDPVPAWMQGSIPLSGGGLLPVGNLSSFGTFSDLTGFVSDLVLPQLGVLEALGGLNWTGDKLTAADGTPLGSFERILPAVYIQAEAWLPFLSLVRRLREQGGSSEPGSTVFSPKAKRQEGTAAALKKWALLKKYPPEIVEYLRSLSNSRQINVPVKGEAETVDPPEGLQDANVDNLQAIPGIGPVTAEAIMDYLGRNPDASVVDLDQVEGIGPATMEEITDELGGYAVNIRPGPTSEDSNVPPWAQRGGGTSPWSDGGDVLRDDDDLPPWARRPSDSYNKLFK